MQEAKKNEKFDFMGKIIIIGDSGVGKTNLITRFCENTFKDSYVATIGVDFKIKTVSVGEIRYKLQIWDTAGQQRFKNITQIYYKGAAGIILTFSITDRTSFQNIERWMHQIQANAPNDVCKVLIATKSDLDSQRQVSTEQATAVAREYGLQFVEASARTGHKIQEAIDLLVQQIHKKYQKAGKVQGLTSKSNQVLIGEKTDKGRKTCAC